MIFSRGTPRSRTKKYVIYYQLGRTCKIYIFVLFNHTTSRVRTKTFYVKIKARTSLVIFFLRIFISIFFVKIIYIYLSLHTVRNIVYTYLPI